MFSAAGAQWVGAKIKVNLEITVSLPQAARAEWPGLE